ncbi:MAG: hypothetical protein JNL70_10370 [Saprospiraceae bacterium]|nr:hypothetical protein [Saprospiraceae bacterium]
MQNIKKKKHLVFYTIMALGLFCLASCKDKNTPTPDPVVAKGTFMFHLHTYIDNNEVDLYDITYTNLEGRKMSLSIAQLYISEIQLVKSDGSTLDISGKKILKLFETETNLVGEVPVGSYKSIRFKVGLDAATNALSPKASADSIILNRPEMWFGSSPQPDGYVFMNVQGKIDTSSTFDKTPVPFSYKIGTNANYKQVSMGIKDFKVEEGKAVFGHIIIDYNRLFNGIQMNQLANLSVTTATANSSTIAAKIVNNIPSMFLYE